LSALIVEMKKQVESPEGMGLKGIVQDALQAYGPPFKLGGDYRGHSPVVMCLLLDSHWYY
jgi:hypothetical protein